MRAHRLLAAAVVTLGATVVPLATPPAGAAVVANVTGTQVNVTLSGDESIDFECNGNVITIDDVAPQPALTCALVTKVVVNGDLGNQSVNGRGLDSSAFAANPPLQVNLAGGNDSVIETDAADDLDLGNGADSVYYGLTGSGSNTSVDLGPGTDRAYLSTSGQTDDQVSMSSSNADLTISGNIGQGPVLRATENVEEVMVQSYDGDDTLSAAGIVAGSAMTQILLYGGNGDDTFIASPLGVTAEGGNGTNTFNGSSGKDWFRSSSNTDVIKLGGGTGNQVTDGPGLRSGGRTVTSSGTDDLYVSQLDGQDAVSRVRPGLALGTATVTNSLNRFGRQGIGTSFDRIWVRFTAPGETSDRSLADVVAVRQDITVDGDPEDDDLVDLTVPNGTWVASLDAGSQSTITPSNPAYGKVTVNNSGPISVHGPWTNKNEGFAHRAIRDLLFRFPGAGERNGIRDALTGGTKTRAQVVAGFVGSDAYHGLDVDRSFKDYLNRQADPGGRTYWVNAIKGGRSLQKFRAQLFGSTEYYNANGASTSSFVTAAYADVLGRQPDDAGRTYWINKINNGTERGVVAKQFLNASESKRTIVQDQYLRFLSRLPTTAEANAGIATLGATADGEQRLIASLATSTSYYDRT